MTGWIPENQAVNKVNQIVNKVGGRSPHPFVDGGQAEGGLPGWSRETARGQGREERFRAGKPNGHPVRGL